MIKERILESPIGYAVWSAPFNRQKAGPVLRMLARSGKTDGKLLDVGCGPGTNTELFLKWDYLGVDLNDKYIASAREKYSNKRFEVGDATKLDLHGQFDVILINSLMHHIDDEGCNSLLGSLSGLLVEDGVVITQEPLVPKNGQRLQRFLMHQDRGDHFRSLEHWKRLFSGGGFQIKDEEFYTMKLAKLFVGWQMYSALLTR